MYKEHPQFTKEQLLKANEEYDSYTKAGASLGIPCKVFRRQLFKALNLIEPADPNKKLCRRCYNEFSRKEENDKSWRRVYVCTDCQSKARDASNQAYYERRRLVRYKNVDVEKRRAYLREWSSRNRDKIAHYKALRRSKYKEGNTPEIKEFIKSLYTNVDRKCRYCPETDNLTLEHILPLSRGGVHECENLDLACSTCNSRKKDKTEEEYFQYLEIFKETLWLDQPNGTP